MYVVQLPLKNKCFSVTHASRTRFTRQISHSRSPPWTVRGFDSDIVFLIIDTSTTAFYNACTSLGFSLPILTFPGQSVNRPLSSLMTTASATSSLSIPQSTISQTTGTGTTLVNPFATISQTAITSLTTQPSTTTAISSSTSPSATHITNSGRKIEGRIQLLLWILAMGSVSNLVF